MITAAKRKSLKASQFAYPKTRKYPIDTIGRARAALSRASSSKNSGTYSHVAKAVRRKYGNRVASVGPKRGTTARPGYRRRRR
ncbi:MAG TPA: DUF6582 domain-containing protein [Chloroflexota bacterium]|nr:DUF6582 domain-containing protein [Chloroflexota bacterium]